ncbi:MAG: chemotaxis protein CheA [Proteobacteria bacterium]|nr:MAG: chemotaxis protein CheA [Pseudomonadota bacterium]
MDDFERELKTGFIEEAAQLLTDAENCFLLLETNPQDRENLEKIFRIAHNLKGSAKAVGFEGLGEFTHEFENLLIQLKDGRIAIGSDSISLLLRCNDHVVAMISHLRDDLDGSPEYATLMAEIRSYVALGGTVVPTQLPADQQELGDLPDASKFADIEDHFYSFPNVEIETVLETRAESQLEAELNTPAKTAASPEQTPGHTSAPVHTDESIRVSLNRLDKLLNYVGEMVIYQTVLREQAYANNPEIMRKSVHQMAKVTKEIQDLAMSLRMVPLKQTFQKMQRIVRDTSASLGKKVQLVIQGEDTEVDKTVLENLADPLVHLIRNAVDHGIESDANRRETGKSAPAEITLKAFHQSGSLIVEVRDNGAGMDANRLRAKAIEKGLLKPGVNLNDRDALQLIFHSGFSTKTNVSDVSGRGVGMDVVKTNIENLQGEIQIETELGRGSCFRIRLPLTLAIIDGMVIRSITERYIIPLTQVHESLRPASSDIHYVSGLGEVLSLRGENLPLYRLRSILTPNQPVLAANESTVIVCRPEGRPFALMVDDIIGQHQVVVKQLGQEHASLKGFSGSAILGDGRPALILELSEITKRSSGSGPKLKTA